MAALFFPESIIMKADNSVTLLSPAEMAQTAEDLAVYKTNKKPTATFLSAILAGVFISIAFAFYITVTTSATDAHSGMTKLVGGLCFSLGLILVVVMGNDLFTSTILTSVAKASRRISFGSMIKNWIMVYLGNFAGALLFVLLIWFAGQTNGLWGLSVLKLASHKLHHTFFEAFCLGILANLMVCFAVWMSYAGRSLIDKSFIMILPVAMFVASGFEHSIANMFMIPLGIIVKNFSTPEFWKLIGATSEQFSHLTLQHFITNNLIPVTLGNIVGGLAVGLPNWQLYLRNKHH